MASTVILPASQRRLRHVEQILARNVALLAPTVNTTKTGSSVKYEVFNDGLYYVLEEVEASSSKEAVAPGSRRVFTSELETETLHPTWGFLPSEVRYKNPQRFRFSLFGVRHSTDAQEVELGLVAKEKEEVLLFSAVFDLAKVTFVSKTIAQLHEVLTFPAHANAQATHPFVILIKCSDGVFFPITASEGPDAPTGRVLLPPKSHLSPSPPPEQLLEDSTSVVGSPLGPGAAALLSNGSIASTNLQQTLGELGMTGGTLNGSIVQFSSTTAGPSGGNTIAPTTSKPGFNPSSTTKPAPKAPDEWDLVDADAVREEERRAQQRADPMSFVDIKTLAESSMSLIRMRQLIALEQQHLRERIQKELEARQGLALINARKHETLLRCENLQWKIAEKRKLLQELKLQNSAAEKECGLRAEAIDVDLKGVQERLARCEQGRRDRSEISALETKVKAAQEKAVAQLVATFPIAGSTIKGHQVPDAEPETEEHAVALGHVAHLVSSYASACGYPLPHPIFVCSSRSYVCEHAGATEQRFPLFPTTRADKLHGKRAIALLLADVTCAAHGIHRRKVLPGSPLIEAVELLIKGTVRERRSVSVLAPNGRR